MSYLLIQRGDLLQDTLTGTISRVVEIRYLTEFVEYLMTNGEVWYNGNFVRLSQR